ncbi:MAG TPA: GIY-YIG nuclease family protein [Candidatus Paceibacterota bacterium]|nr:GIY-YIG nuclease family protein [Candidatus Paceibacterota bacterium]
MDAPDIKAASAAAPKSPGVYTWRAKDGTALYIGKANDLRSRLSSYLKAADARIAAMTREAARLDWQMTETDIEALILESQLIKRRRPKYNIDLRDDKSYFLVAVTDEEFPQFIPTHQVRSARLKKPVREFLGPFTDGGALKTTLKVLRRMFPYCSCAQKHHVRCLNAHIGVCSGYCCLRAKATAAQKREYARYVRAVRDILTGKRDVLIRRLERRMKKAADRRDLEAARDLQIQADRLRRVFTNARLVASRRRLAARHAGAPEQLAEEFALVRAPQRIEGYDAAHIQGAHPAGAVVVFTDGRADNSEYRLFNIRTPEAGDVAAIREILTRRLAHDEWPLPDLILVDGAKAQMNAALKVLDSADLDIPVIAFAKDDKHRGAYVLFSGDSRVRTLKDLPAAARNLLGHVDSEAHRFVVAQYRKRHRKHQLAPHQSRPLRRRSAE